MVYAYIRVSTDDQDVENQRHAITQYCQSNSIEVGKWIVDQSVSGKKSAKDRALGKYLHKMQAGDILMVMEISRMGRVMIDVINTVVNLIDKKCALITCRDNKRYAHTDAFSILMLSLYTFFAQQEREMISARTKEGLARRRAEGVVLGRPRGRKSDSLKLDSKKSKVLELIEAGKSYAEIARRLKVNRMTVSSFVKRNGLPESNRAKAQNINQNPQ